jgi:hypothetical protein
MVEKAKILSTFSPSSRIVVILSSPSEAKSVVRRWIVWSYLLQSTHHHGKIELSWRIPLFKQPQRNPLISSAGELG